MTDDQLYTSLSANTIMAKLTNHVQRTNFITSSTDKYYPLDSEDDFRSGCRNASHQQQFFSELPSPGLSHNTNYWYSWIQTFAEYFFCRQLTEFDFFLIHCFVDETWLRTQQLDICRINFHIRSNVGIMTGYRDTVNQSESQNCVIRGWEFTKGLKTNLFLIAK